MANPSSFHWVEPTVNTDGTPLVGSEITGYTVGVRQGGTAGTYPNTVSVTGNTTLTALISAVTPALLSGTYEAAVMSVGPTNSAWSSEITFTLAGTPVPPTSFSVA
jgi:hypothetical protein